MKRKNIQIDESMLISDQEQNSIRGGTRVRVRYPDGTKVKTIY